MNKLDSAVEKVYQSKVVKKGQNFIGSHKGFRFVSIISFLESFLPVPILTDPFLVAAILANKTNAFKLIVATTFWSVVGGVFAYFTALFFFEWLLDILDSGLVEELQIMINTNTANTFVLTIIGAVTPIPYTLVAWTVAVLDGMLLIFILASILGRGVRYFVVGYCTYKFGSSAVSHVKRYSGLVTVVTVLLVVLYVWNKL